MGTRFVKLTRSAIRALKSGESITEAGISFKREQNGDGVFSINIMIEGERIHRVIGRESDGTTKQQVTEYINKLRHDAKMGRLALPKGRKISLSFVDAARKYLSKLDEEVGKDLVMKRRRLENHLVKFFGAMPLSKLSSFDVERYKKFRLEECAMRGKRKDGSAVYAGKTKPATVNRELAVLSHLMNKAVEWGWLGHSPVKIRRLQEGGGRIAYLTLEQMESLLDCAIRDRNPQIYPFILIGLNTSMRLSEILSIRRENVKLERMIIYIPKAKAGAREQPITPELARFLKEYLACLPIGTEWLFHSPASVTGHTVNVRKAFRRVVAHAGLDLDSVTPHTLRHTAITHLVQAGVDLPTVQRISGHKNLSMIQRYAHQNGAHVAESMEKLDTRYQSTARVLTGLHKNYTTELR